MRSSGFLCYFVLLQYLTHFWVKWKWNHTLLWVRTDALSSIKRGNNKHGLLITHEKGERDADINGTFGSLLQQTAALMLRFIDLQGDCSECELTQLLFWEQISIWPLGGQQSYQNTVMLKQMSYCCFSQALTWRHFIIVYNKILQEELVQCYKWVETECFFLILCTVEWPHISKCLVNFQLLLSFHEHFQSDWAPK